MTISLAVAFSVAVTGPPTNTEIDLVTGAVSDAFTDFGNELEAAAIQLCPDLPPDVQAEFCPVPAPPRAEPPPPPPAPPPQVERVDVVLDEPLPPEATETELLGGPASPSARRGRAEPPSRATSRRANAERPAVQRSAVRTAPPRQSHRVARTPQRPARAVPAAPRASKPPPSEASRDWPVFMGQASDEPPADAMEETEEENWSDVSGERSYEQHPPPDEDYEDEASIAEEEEFYDWERSYYWDELY